MHLAGRVSAPPVARSAGQASAGRAPRRQRTRTWRTGGTSRLPLMHLHPWERGNEVKRRRCRTGRFSRRVWFGRDFPILGHEQQSGLCVDSAGSRPERASQASERRRSLILHSGRDFDVDVAVRFCIYRRATIPARPDWCCSSAGGVGDVGCSCWSAVGGAWGAHGRKPARAFVDPCRPSSRSARTAALLFAVPARAGVAALTAAPG